MERVVSVQGGPTHPTSRQTRGNHSQLCLWTPACRCCRLLLHLVSPAPFPAQMLRISGLNLTVASPPAPSKPSSPCRGAATPAAQVPLAWRLLTGPGRIDCVGYPWCWGQALTLGGPSDPKRSCSLATVALTSCTLFLPRRDPATNIQSRARLCC